MNRRFITGSGRGAAGNPTRVIRLIFKCDIPGKIICKLKPVVSYIRLGKMRGIAGEIEAEKSALGLFAYFTPG